MIHHCKDDGKVLVHFALNNKYWCPKCKLFRTRVEVAFVKGGKYEAESNVDNGVLCGVDAAAST